VDLVISSRRSLHGGAHNMYCLIESGVHDRNHS